MERVYDLNQFGFRRGGKRGAIRLRLKATADLITQTRRSFSKGWAGMYTKYMTVAKRAANNA